MRSVVPAGQAVHTRSDVAVGAAVAMKPAAHPDTFAHTRSLVKPTFCCWYCPAPQSRACTQRRASTSPYMSPGHEDTHSPGTRKVVLPHAVQTVGPRAEHVRHAGLHGMHFFRNRFPYCPSGQDGTHSWPLISKNQ